MAPVGQMATQPWQAVQSGEKVILTYVATKGQVLYGTELLFAYAIGHCLLMLLAGTFTGFIESFVKQKGIVNFSAWTKRFGGAVVACVGVYLLLNTCFLG